jgi:hypothetical protein
VEAVLSFNFNDNSKLNLKYDGMIQRSAEGIVRPENEVEASAYEKRVGEILVNMVRFLYDHIEVIGEFTLVLEN